ncbi:type II toxin-antitoxin system HipA family toxin [Glutamicibacter mishrai]|uniref:type II toxin-antitoxin system HipA family toxin n=1 Tax=Glutamicibacter mishrai TaxID=1775880 RepID=UPI0020CE0DF4|nr:type II toxin-antitoxin system HipA family toxin [Glutamicibacter mishrai]UTT39443.1 type II toxin-antitoxin system HipA family toxin [Glutamicibacter mishrai]
MSEKYESLAIDLQDPSGQWIAVGHIHSRNDRNWFESTSEYWRMTNRPVLGQRFEDTGHDWRPNARAALPKWFSHLLPEGRLRVEIAHAANLSPAREFKLLERIGMNDLPGATRATRIDQNGVPLTPPEDSESDDASDAASVLKFSLAGVQLKFSISDGDRGPTVPVRGQSGTAILKMPDSRSGFEGVPEAEYAAMKLAEAAGLNVASVRLTDANKIAGIENWASKLQGPSLLVDRFDRQNEQQRIHAEEFAQILDISATSHNAKYRKANFETIANIVAKMIDVESVGEVIDRIVFNILIGNGDAHLKNWGVIYPDGKKPILGPAYDIVPTVLFIKNDDLGLNLNKTKSFHEISSSDFERIGAVTEFGIRESRERAELMVARVLENWNTLRELLPLDRFSYLEKRLSKLKITSQ